MNKQKGKIITVISTKGGIGKTITTLNLAATFHNLGKKTLVIDLDIFSGAVATYLNSTNDRTIFNLVEDLTNNRFSQVEDYIYNHNEFIDIIAAPKDPRSANKIDVKYIPLILNNVLYKYDVILIDTTHTLNDLNIVTMDNSDKIVYVFTNDAFDLKTTRSFMSIIKDVGMDNVYTLLNEARDPSRNYFSMYDIRNIIKRNVDFTISKNLYIKNIDKYILEGEILFLNKNLSFRNGKDYKKFEELATLLIEDKEEGK